jgi:hypothetical protein
MEQLESIEQIQDLLQIIYRYTFSGPLDQVQLSVAFSNLLNHLTREEQDQFQQLINKLIMNIAR